MKNTFVIVFLIFFSFSAKSQVLLSLIFGDKLNSPKIEFGLEGGLNWSQVGGFESNSLNGIWNLGFYFNFKLKDHIYINTGTLVKSSYSLGKLTSADLTTMMVNEYNETGSYSLVMNSFMVPVLFKYKLDNSLYFAGGIQASLMSKSHVLFESKDKEAESEIKQFVTDQVKRLDVGFMAALGYTITKGNGLGVNVKYYYGMVDVVKNVSGSNNSSIFLTFNIPVGAKTKNKEKKKDDGTKKDID